MIPEHVQIYILTNQIGTAIKVIPQSGTVNWTSAWSNQDSYLLANYCDDSDRLVVKEGRWAGTDCMFGYL